MRSKIEAYEYKDYILGFIFYKYLSDKEVKFLKDNDFSSSDIRELSVDDQETFEFIQKNLGYFISYKDLFSTWIDMGKDFDVSNVIDALNAFSRLISNSHKKVFDKIFNTLQTGLSKLGDSSGTQTKAIGDLIQLIKDIPMDGKQDYDVLGFIYEDLISKFASNAGKKAGEFYTPHEVSLLMSEIVADHLKGHSEISIYDPTSGSGSLLINIGKSISKFIKDENSIKYYAQELKENTYNLTRMNLVMRGINPDNIVTRNGDTLAEDWPYFDDNDLVKTYNPLYVEAVVSNPPYSQVWDPSNMETDARYSRYGVAPKSKADFAFLLHDLYHVKPGGIMTIVLPHGVLFRGGKEGEIRRNLIEYNNIDAIIGLPPNIFFGTGIPTVILVLKQKKENTDLLIIDASKGFIKEGKNNKLRASDIKKIVDVVASRQSIPKFSKLVSLEEIRENEYNLNIPRYVDSSENPESWDLYSSMFGGIPKSEINELKEYWVSFPNLKHDLFTDSDIPYVDLKTNEVKAAIQNHPEVIGFESKFTSAFESFKDKLILELINNFENVDINQKESDLSKDIFLRLNKMPLIDKYEAYQILNYNYERISNDLEILQSEGLSSAKKVDPKLVIKKKGDLEQEIQEGWVGHIFPFELIQNTLLKQDYEKIQTNESRLSEIPSEVEEILESLSEEEKESTVLNEAKDAFVAKKITLKLKELKNEEQTEEVIEFTEKLKKVESLIQEEKEVKSLLKKETKKLQAKTKVTIESLNEDEIRLLLEKKWVNPIMESLLKLPETIVDNLVEKLQNIQKKYETTYFDIEAQILETEKTISSMLDDLVGDEFDMKAINEFKSILSGE